MRYDERLSELALAQHGLVTRRQLRELGLSDTEIDLRFRNGWEALSDRVLHRTGAPLTDGTRSMALVLDCGSDAVLSHQDGARWWGISGFERAQPSVITTVRSRRRSQLGDVHVVRLVPPAWITSFRGIPIARPELVMLHLCATEHPARAERALDHAWNLRLLSGASLTACVAQLGASGRNGTLVLRQLVDARGPGYVPPASNLEARAIEVLRPLGLVLRRQVDLGGAAWDGRVDLLVEEFPIVIEIQSEKYHSALSDRRADQIRFARLRADGFTIVEVTDTEVWTRPKVVRARVSAAVSPFRSARPT